MQVNVSRQSPVASASRASFQFYASLFYVSRCALCSVRSAFCYCC